MRYHAHCPTNGQGHVDQQRYKSFPVQDDDHFLVVCRYVERNALRAGLVRRAEDWQWGSLWRWRHPEVVDRVPLAAWPTPRSRNWVARVNQPETEAELKALRQSISRGRPYGREAWVARVSRRFAVDGGPSRRRGATAAWDFCVG